MPIPITCEYCEESYRITDKAAGKRIRCKECGEAIDVPGRATTRSASRTSSAPASRSRSRSAGPPSRSAKPARSKSSKPRPSKSRSHISNRRERQNDDEHTKNLIMGVCIAAISIIGGGAFLVFGRGDSQANLLAQANFEAQKEAERERMNQDAADWHRESQEQARRIVEDGKRMTDGLNDFSSDMGRPDMTPPNTTTPGMTPPGMGSPNTTTPGMPPGMSPPSYTPPNSSRPGFTRPGSTIPPGFGPPNLGEPGGNRPGTPFGGSRGGAIGDIPRSAESDADLAALEQAMKSGNISSRIRAASTLSRSSRKAEAARILAENITERDEGSMVNQLAGMGEVAEPHLLKLLQTVPLDQFSRAVPILSALGRCGTEKSLPVLEKIAKSGSPAAGIASISATRIRSKR